MKSPFERPPRDFSQPAKPAVAAASQPAKAGGAVQLDRGVV